MPTSFEIFAFNPGSSYYKQRPKTATPTTAKHAARAKVPWTPTPTSYPDSAFAAPEEVAVVATAVGRVTLGVGLTVVDVKSDEVAGLPVGDS